MADKTWNDKTFIAYKKEEEKKKERTTLETSFH